MKNTLHINLWAGPGTGKSGLSGLLYGKLKETHIDCELVREYAKELYWEGKLKETEQLIISTEQYKRELLIEGKNDVAIIDTSLLSGILHCPETYRQNLTDILFTLTKSWNMKHYFIERNLNSPYEHNGRRHTLSQSLELDNQILDFFRLHNIKYTTIKIENALEYILEDIKNNLITAKS